MLRISDIEKILRDYFGSKNNVYKVILFGSYARGTQDRRSDIDLLVVCETTEPFFRRHREFMELYELFSEELDLLIYTPSEWQGIKDRPFFKRVLEEGKVIYERGEI